MKRLFNFLNWIKPADSTTKAEDAQIALGHDFYYASSDEYKKWQSNEIEKISIEHSSAELLIWLKHHNGYLREAALRRVGVLEASSCWSSVLALVNDWVPAIRREAKSVALRWLNHADIDLFITHALALDALRLKQRETHVEFIDQFEAWLIQDQHIDCLVKAASNDLQPKLSRYCFSLLLRTNLSRSQLIDLGLKSSNVVVQEKILQLIRKMPSDQQLQYAHRLLNSKRNFLCWYGLDFLRQHASELAHQQSFNYLLSPYTALRDKAHSLCGLSKPELLEFLWQKVQLVNASSNEIVVGLQLLSNTKDKKYLSFVEACFSHGSNRVRAASLLALVKLSPDAAEPIAVSAILSDSPSIGRAGVAVVKTLQIQPSQEQWKSLIQQSQSEMVIGRILNWSNSTNKWIELAVLLEIAASQPKYAVVCKDRLLAWKQKINYTWLQLDDANRLWILKNIQFSTQLGSSPKAIQFLMD
jgi:hypothetical protein